MKNDTGLFGGQHPHTSPDKSIHWVFLKALVSVLSHWCSFISTGVHFHFVAPFPETVERDIPIILHSKLPEPQTSLESVTIAQKKYTLQQRASYNI
eukprot:scaffold1761_cov140-Skeletonema_marinoi.AAC.3